MTARATTTLWMTVQLLSAAAATEAAALPAHRAGTPSTVVALLDTGFVRAPRGQFDAARFDTLTANALRLLFDEAAAKGLPTAPLINRALEGAARRVNGARILSVVRAHAVALAEAKGALGDISTVAELDAGADAIRAGIDLKTLSSVRGTRHAGSAVTALVVLTDVVNRGVPTPTARDAVTALARLPQSDDALLGLQLTVAKNALRGPGMALAALNRYVRATVAGTVTPSIPATSDRKPVRPPDP